MEVKGKEKKIILMWLGRKILCGEGKRPQGVETEER